MASTFRTDYLPYICCGFFVVPFCTGVVGVFRPRALLSGFGFPERPTGPEGKLTDSLLRAFAWRDITLGALACATLYAGDRTSIGYFTIVGSIAPFADGLVALQHTGGGVLVHWIFVPAIVSAGAAMLDWI